ncbi:predicted protein [Sclerotinia sclerotiorum 1980 UF-70]|uniref:Uncharacterized protein n=2 Tax=Sclerotinia sclerotiorum (strain ATCC 18683 / 1980 / Ss-1) TaxID=665079 RepID=A7EV72_SCLS1|nr:predicted protein [Sclerotinia sclerotiorum 1980 UF-70]APA15888.1 hypothetical protein sscle_15g106580 [Sclerotinia sclerotiorum 1980 UF-70]EDN93364.1 predicted protein [Sclerotinia sclerotiorum 1980 UF-70]
MALVVSRNSSESGGDDMSETIEPPFPAMATMPSSPQTPKIKSISNKRGIDISSTLCSMSRLNVGTLELAGHEVRSVEKDTGARDSPSPTKKRRISRLSVQEKDSEPFTSSSCGNSLFKVDENKKFVPFDDDKEKIYERVEHILSQERKEMAEVEKHFLDHVELCGGIEQKKMALNNIVDGEDYVKEETHGKFELAIRTENLEKNIRSVQKREERAETDVTHLDSLGEDMAESSESAFGSKTLSKTVQSVRDRKERTEMAPKTFELLNGLVETNSNDGLKEMRSLADGFERVIMRLKLEERLQMALEQKEGAEIYPKEMETSEDEVGAGNKKTLLTTEILKSFIIGRLEEDLQMLKETLETSFERLEHLNDEIETSFNKAKEAQLSVDITSDAALLLENDLEVRIPPANEDVVVTMEDIRYKISEASTSTAELLTHQGSTITQAGSLPSDTDQCSTYMRGGSLSRNSVEIPKPKDFDDEDAMLQQALIQSNYDEFLKAKVCDCSFACSHKSHINKDTKPDTVENDEEISSIFLDISGAEEDDDDDEISDSCSSESDYTAVYIRGREQSGLDEKKRPKTGETMRDADEPAKLVNRVKEGLLAAIAEQLKNISIQMFPQKCIVLTEDNGVNGVDEKLIEETATIIKRAFKHFNVDVFNKALTEASEKAMAEAEAGASSAMASSRPKHLVRENIFMKWESAYAQINLMRPDELMRAIGVLISFTKSTPYASATLKNTPESEYDALAVYIHYYLQMCVQIKCMDIAKGGGCPEEDEKWRTDMPCFISWWRQVSHERKEEFRREWNMGVLSKEILNSVEADGGAGAEGMVDKLSLCACACASCRCY